MILLDIEYFFIYLTTCSFLQKYYSFAMNMKTKHFFSTIILVFGLISFSYAQSPTADLLKKIDKSDNYKEKANLWNELAFIYFNFNTDSAKIVLALAHQSALENEYVYGISRALIGYGYYEITSDNYLACINYLDEAMAYYDQIEKKKLFGSAYNAYGIAYQAVAEYDKALEYYQKAYDNMIEQGRDASPILGNMGNIHNEMFNFEEGLEYFNRGLEGAKKTGNPYMILQFKTNIATVYADMKQYTKAITMYHEVIPDALKLGVEQNTALAYGNTGKAFYYLNQYDSAAYYIEKAIPMLADLNKTTFLISDLNVLGEVYAKKGLFAKAKTNLEEAEKLADELGSIDKLSGVYKSWAVYFEEKDDFRQALEYQRKSSVLEDSVHSTEQQSKIARLETKFNFREQQKEIELLNAETQLQSAEISKQKLKANFSIAGAILLLIILLLIIFQYIKTKKVNRSLTLKNLELMKAEESNETLREDNQNYADAHKDDVLVKMEKLMKQDKIYTKTKITIDDLATKLNTNRSYLSQIINSHFKTNYKSFINSYRISEARRLLVNPSFENYTIEAIANEVGFGSKSVFNEIFKRETGITPSIFQRNAKSF